MNQRKILLLENVATQAAGVREDLSRAGYQVAIARYEADGLKRLLEWGPDLVLVSTAHPAGDFVEYCRRVRSLAPAVRIIVTSQFDSQRLFQAYPDLQEIVDGVLLRPYGHEEVVAMLATAPVASGAPAAVSVADSDNAELRAQFQRRLDDKFLEVEELRRGEIEARTRELEQARGLLLELRESSAKAAEENAALRVEMERALVEKEQLEEKLHALMAARSAADALPVVPPEAELRVASLEAELSRQRALAAEGQVSLADMTAKAAVLEEALAREPADREERKQLLLQVQALREQASEAQRLSLEHRSEAAASEAARVSVAAAAEAAVERHTAEVAEVRARHTGMLAARERVHAEEVRAWRDKVEAAALEVQLVRSQEAERAGREAEERRAMGERQEQAGKELAERERQVASLREELAAAAGPGPVQAELRRIQELLEEVISRARTEAVDYARRDAELSVRLQAALDERRLLQERFERVSVEATERERRSSSLLQSAIERGASPTVERANLPAIVPLDPGRAAPRWRPVLAGLAVASLVALLAVFGLRRTGPPAVRDQQPAVPRPQRGASPGPGASPREIWERWTRSDSSGGVLVQATLRSEVEVRAEVEADRALGADEAAVRAELARRLAAFRFDTAYYVTVYLKNLAPGYPAYLDDLPGRFRLRDSAGREVSAFLPPGHETDRRIFTFGAGAPGDLIYEASVSLGFERAGLSPSADYLQLVVSDVGAASRRVLTWELE